MTIFEKAKEIIINNEISFDEIYNGIAFVYYMDEITHEQYKILMELLEG